MAGGVSWPTDTLDRLSRFLPPTAQVPYAPGQAPDNIPAAVFAQPAPVAPAAVPPAATNGWQYLPTMLAAHQAADTTAAADRARGNDAGAAGALARQVVTVPAAMAYDTIVHPTGSVLGALGRFALGAGGAAPSTGPISASQMPPKKDAAAAQAKAATQGTPAAPTPVLRSNNPYDQMAGAMSYLLNRPEGFNLHQLGLLSAAMGQVGRPTGLPSTDVVRDAAFDDLNKTYENSKAYAQATAKNPEEMSKLLQDYHDKYQQGLKDLLFRADPLENMTPTPKG